MAKNPEKITIKIKKEDLNDLDEITIEIPQKQSITEKSIEKVVDTVREIDASTVKDTMDAVKHFLVHKVLVVVCVLAMILLVVFAVLPT